MTSCSVVCHAFQYHQRINEQKKLSLNLWDVGDNDDGGGGGGDDHDNGDDNYDDERFA